MDECKSIPLTTTRRDSIESFGVMESPVVQPPSELDSTPHTNTSTTYITNGTVGYKASCIEAEAENDVMAHPGFEADYDDCSTYSTESRLRCMIDEAKKDILAQTSKWMQAELEEQNSSLMDTIQKSMKLFEDDVRNEFSIEKLDSKTVPQVALQEFRKVLDKKEAVEKIWKREQQLRMENLDVQVWALTHRQNDTTEVLEKTLKDWKSFEKVAWVMNNDERRSTQNRLEKLEKAQAQGKSSFIFNGLVMLIALFEAWVLYIVYRHVTAKV